ncbi:unnamed protein product [Pieris brassicae]|uniref:Uncharacterized protein n=1 Tax=Pieris brassicae TaxID=7116 RepID=A0A9P0TLG7_PIEBR|nr:unnamed protein product [Pieris brassicae]
MIEGHLYYKTDDGVLKNVCQRNKTTSMINPRKINASNKITDSKKKDLLTLLRSHWGNDWQQNGHLSFFVALLESNKQHENEDKECNLECEEYQEVDDLDV